MGPGPQRGGPLRHDRAGQARCLREVVGPPRRSSAPPRELDGNNQLASSAMIPPCPKGQAPATSSSPSRIWSLAWEPLWHRDGLGMRRRQGRMNTSECLRSSRGVDYTFGSRPRDCSTG